MVNLVKQPMYGQQSMGRSHELRNRESRFGVLVVWVLMKSHGHSRKKVKNALNAYLEDDNGGIKKEKKNWVSTDGVAKGGMGRDLQ